MGCVDSTKFISNKPVIGAIDSALTKECADPVAIPDHMLSQKETEKYWGQDRKEKVECKQEHHGLVQVITTRDNALRGN